MNDADDTADPNCDAEDAFDPIFANAPILRFSYPSATGISLADLQRLFRPDSSDE